MRIRRADYKNKNGLTGFKDLIDRIARQLAGEQDSENEASFEALLTKSFLMRICRTNTMPSYEEEEIGPEPAFQICRSL